MHFLTQLLFTDFYAISPLGNSCSLNLLLFYCSSLLHYNNIDKVIKVTCSIVCQQQQQQQQQNWDIVLNSSRSFSCLPAREKRRGTTENDVIFPFLFCHPFTFTFFFRFWTLTSKNLWQWNGFTGGTLPGSGLNFITKLFDVS